MFAIVDKKSTSEYLRPYLLGVPPSLIRSYVISMLIIPVLFFSFGSFVPPMVTSLAYFLMGVVTVFTLWGAWIAAVPRRAQRVYFLYLGLLCAFTSFGLVVVSIKFVYFNMLIEQLWYPLILIAGYIILAYRLWRWHLKALYSGVYASKEKRNGPNPIMVGFTGYATVAGIVGSQIFLAQNPNYDTSFAVLACLMLLLGLILLLGVHNVHKYALMLRHPNLVTYYGDQP